MATTCPRASSATGGLRLLRRWRDASIAGAGLALASCALAANWTSQPAISSQLTLLSRPLIGITASKGATLVVTPRWSLFGQGSRFRIDLRAAVSAVEYSDSSVDTRFLPALSLDSRLEAIEKWLFVQTDARIAQTVINPFGLSTGDVTSTNTITTRTLRVTPYVESRSGASVEYRVRSENAIIRDDRASGTLIGRSAEGYFGRHLGYIGMVARPFGWRLEGQRNVTRYRDETVPELISNQAVATVSYRIVEGLTFGVRAGAERNNFFNAPGGINQRIRGVRVDWRPNPRTSLDLVADDRFFGRAWSVNFGYRQPRVALGVVLDRDIYTAPRALVALPATADTAALLDAMLTTRFPDPIERASQVQAVINQYGLPSALTGLTPIYSQFLSLRNRATATVSYLAPRSSVAASVFYARQQDLPGATVLVTGSPLTNNLQRGLVLVFSHRVTPAASVSLTADARRTTALQTVSGGGQADEARIQLRGNVQANLRTDLSFGGQYRRLTSTVVSSGREVSAFAGFDHRF